MSKLDRFLVGEPSAILITTDKMIKIVFTHPPSVELIQKFFSEFEREDFGFSNLISHAITRRKKDQSDINRLEWYLFYPICFSKSQILQVVTEILSENNIVLRSTHQ